MDIAAHMHAQGSPRAGERGLRLAQLFYLFLFGCLMGYLAETVYFLLTTGEYLHRASLVYGPLNTVYGAGALALYLALSGLQGKRWYWVFLIGALTGTVTEFAFSWLQEAVLGTLSWDYSAHPLNICGRVWIGATLSWGALALLWVYALYPGFSWLAARLLRGRIVVPIALCLFILLAIDGILSIAAVVRWSMRLEGAPAATWLAHAIDRLFPNAFMEWVYQGMRFIPGR